MDLKVTISDENGTVLEQVVIYQDGSDLEGAKQIVDMIGMRFEMFDDTPKECVECGAYFDDADGNVCATCMDWDSRP